MIRESISIEQLPEIAAIDRGQWQRLLSQTSTDAVFLTQEWQQAWWDVYGRGELLLLAAKKGTTLRALASLFAEDGMAYFVGSGGADYLDFIGDLSGPATLDAMLAVARDLVAGFVGFRFYLVPEGSPTVGILAQAAARLGLRFCDEGYMVAPRLDLRIPGMAEAVVSKKSLRRHERFFEERGGVTVSHARTEAGILPYLDAFFDQHIGRWEGTPFPSLFLVDRHRQFYRRLTEEAATAGWLRFTRVEWQGRCIAAHFGFNYAGAFLWYKPAFAVDLARHSPGEVLIRHLLRLSIDEGASAFDFGIGDEPFKLRFATSVPRVRTFGLYADNPGH